MNRLPRVDPLPRLSVGNGEPVHAKEGELIILYSYRRKNRQSSYRMDEAFYQVDFPHNYHLEREGLAVIREVSWPQKYEVPHFALELMRSGRENYRMIITAPDLIEWGILEPMRRGRAVGPVEVVGGADDPYDRSRFLEEASEKIQETC